MIYAIIENDVVINLIVADAAFIKENKINGVKVDGLDVQIGATYSDKTFINPAPILLIKESDETIPE